MLKEFERKPKHVIDCSKGDDDASSFVVSNLVKGGRYAGQTTSQMSMHDYKSITSFSLNKPIE